MSVQTTARNATLADLAELLKDQQARKVDMVVPASKIRSVDGVLEIKGSDPVITEDGVDLADGLYRPTSVCDEGIAAKLEVPLAYVRRMRNERPDLYDANVNGWLQGAKEKTRMRQGLMGMVPEKIRDAIPADPRSFLIRTFKPGDGETEGIARAFLSDSYKVIDHLDSLTAALDGIRQAGTPVEIRSCDLSERRMVVKVVAPEIAAMAPALLEGYRSPFESSGHGQAGLRDADGNLPVVFAGFVLANSETGGGAFTITPRLEIKVCTNGMVITKDALRAVHLGGRMEEGVINWSEATQQKNLELITSKTTDAVRTFIDADYLSRAIREIEEKAGKPLTNAVEQIKVVGKRLAFSQATVDGVLDHFVRGGQTTAGGVMQAVTSFAQTLSDPDAAYDLEAAGLRALETAAAL